MHSTILNNINLGEAPMPAALYNKLPSINDMRNVAAKHAKAHAQLLGLIALHGQSERFSIHLIHKHFEIPAGRVMVYETIRGPNHPDFVLCSPRDPTKVHNLRGLYFKAFPEGTMAAYEYTTEPGEDMAEHAAFVGQFARKTVALGVQDVFALTAKKPFQETLTEFEMSDVISTILVNSPVWLPADAEQSTATDWSATSDYLQYAHASDDKVPGIITLKCLQTRSNGHYNVTCSKTRAGSHYQSKPALSTGELLLDGKPLAQDSEPFAIISHARALIEAV